MQGSVCVTVFYALWQEKIDLRLSRSLLSMIWEFQLYLYPANPALSGSINDILLHTGTAALG